jgi:hypothetical protein
MPVTVCARQKMACARCGVVDRGADAVRMAPKHLEMTRRVIGVRVAATGRRPQRGTWRDVPVGNTSPD